MVWILKCFKSFFWLFQTPVTKKTKTKKMKKYAKFLNVHCTYVHT